VFTLKNINTDKVDVKYNITLISNINNNDNQPTNTTKLTELNIDHTMDIISFLDESKRLYQCSISMIDFSSGKDVESFRYKCFWCRNNFNTMSIGCPIKYISSNAIKSYYSEVSKDNYIIKENITKIKRQKYEEKSDPNIFVEKNEFFLTDGIFCSFNCCKAFIKDNKHNTMYNKSDTLLSKLYTDITGVKNSIIINPAPHWRLLSEYGGNMAISQFRENFNKADYEYHGIYRKKDLFKPIGMLFEEKINF
jgi:hypothetical protein